MSTLPPGAIVRSLSSVFGERVFFVSGGRRHWIRDSRWFAQHGLVWPDSVVDVPPEVLPSFLPAGPAPLAWPESECESPPAEGRTSLDMREIAAGRLQGRGVEVGAGASPFPVPLHCRVLYADRLAHTDLESELYPGQLRQDLVDPDLQTDLETLAGIPDDSLDFVVACHVIEHTRNPIGALATAWRRLRHGGKLLLVVPDKTRTFDRNREVTPLSHLIDDFERPDRERDRAHYAEFYRVAFTCPAEQYEQTVRARFEEGYAIHYHTWTFESFAAMVEWAMAAAAPFSEVWSQPPCPDPVNDIEFCFVLTK
jgi:predicted SAM-dependent methyltransferase